MRNLVGKRFNRWLVLKHLTVDGRTKCLCKCDCGTEKTVYSSSLIQGSSQSCGCLQKELLSERRRLKDGEAAFNNLLSKYKASATKRGYVWGLSKDEFKQLTKENCYYCGTEPYRIFKAKSHNTGFYQYNGIDRVENNIGYEFDNVVPCCRECNTAKLDRSVADFITWAKKVAAYNEQRRI